MNSLDPDFEKLSIEQLSKIDTLCSDYERERKQGGNVTIESIVQRSTPDIREALECELIQIELEILDSWDQLHTLPQLEQRFPEHLVQLRKQSNELKQRQEPFAEQTETHVHSAASGSTLNEANEMRPFSDEPTELPGNHVHTPRFHILRNLAEGGIGTVYVAFDRDLQREVAIKELKRKFTRDRAVVYRFEKEASVTGNLEHPNIVPIYATGKRSDGRPYYAMRLIRGKSMAAFIADMHAQKLPPEDLHSSPLCRDLIFRFVTVCRAIGFAHSRGIIHRDLKPSNIMLGDFGETLVVDWGLARSLSDLSPGQLALPNDTKDTFESSQQTMAGTVVGTPGYMSPEQANGNTAEVSPASDVYSLGATLFQLLTNEVPYMHTGMHSAPKNAPPFLASSDDHNTGVFVGNGVYPTSFERLLHKHKLPPQLRAICLRSMEFEPKKRYGSAELLANDLEAWLLGEPITALPESAWQHVKRWAKRHPAIVASTMVGLLISVLALGITLSLLANKNEALSQSYAREQLASQEAEKNAKVAEEQSVEALAQRERVLGILKTFLFDVQEGLANIPGGATVQRNVLTTVLNQLGEVSREFVDDKDAQHSNAMALVELADLFSRVGSTDIELDLPGWDKTKLSPLEAASTLYQEALKLEQNIADTNKAQTRRAIPLIQSKRAEILVQLADTPNAIKHFEEALSAQKALWKEEPHSIQPAMDLAMSMDGIGKIWLANEKLKQAEEIYQEMLTLLLPYTEKENTESQQAKSLETVKDNAEREVLDRELQRLIGLVYSRLADIAAKNGDLTRAAELYQNDLIISKKLYQENPNQLSAKRDLCIVLDRLGNMASKKGQIREALAYYQESLQIREELHAAEPLSSRVKRELFVSFMKCGDTRMMLDEVDLAKEDYDKALTIADEMARMDPANAVASQFQSICAEVLADVAIKEEKFDEALTYANRSLEISERLLAKDPTDAQKQDDVLICKLKVAKVLYNAGAYDAALADLNLLLPSVKSAYEEQVGILARAMDYSIVLLRIAEAQLATKQSAEAEENCKTTLQVFESVPAENRQDAIALRRIVNAWTMLGRAQADLQKFDEARKSLERAKELTLEMIANQVRVEQMKADLEEIETLLDSIHP